MRMAWSGTLMPVKHTPAVFFEEMQEAITVRVVRVAPDRSGHRVRRDLLQRLPSRRPVDLQLDRRAVRARWRHVVLVVDEKAMPRVLQRFTPHPNPSAQTFARIAELSAVVVTQRLAARNAPHRNHRVADPRLDDPGEGARGFGDVGFVAHAPDAAPAPTAGTYARAQRRSLEERRANVD